MKTLFKISTIGTPVYNESETCIIGYDNIQISYKAVLNTEVEDFLESLENGENTPHVKTIINDLPDCFTIVDIEEFKKQFKRELGWHTDTYLEGVAERLLK